MRIIAGTAGGRRLLAPPEGTRPTTDRVREALFSSLDAYLLDRPGGWSTVRFLDLFAGSGAIGLEALSRGAQSATLVERDRRCVDVLRRNVATIDPRAEVVKADALTWVPEGGPFDIAYLDPPYALDDDAVRTLLAALASGDALVPDSLVIVERSTRSPAPWPEGTWRDLRKREYGDTVLWYGRP